MIKTLIGFVVLWTVAGHGLLVWAILRLELNWPETLALCGLVVVLGGLLPPLCRGGLFRDVPCPAWRVWLLEEPAFAHWAATLALPLAAGLGVAVTGGALAASVFGGYGAGLLLSAWAVWGRRQWVVIRRHDVALRGLPAEFDGYRIAQLSDLHVGRFARPERVAGWMARANGLAPDMIAVTGDLVSSGTAYYESVARSLGQLQCADGVFVSLGNHDQWDKEQLKAELAQHGLQVLENSGRRIRRGPAAVYVAGLGDHYTGCADLDDTLADRGAGDVTVLLAHYPASWGAIKGRQVELTLSGHTHGGQIVIPLFPRRWNLAAFFGRYVLGWYHAGSCHLYVNAGLGTTGAPMRFGVPPEIALITLRRIPTSSRADF